MIKWRRKAPKSRCTLAGTTTGATERFTCLHPPWDTILTETGRDKDGRYWADAPAMPGVMGYGSSPEAAVQAVRCLALRVAADLMDAGELLPEPFENVIAVYGAVASSVIWKLGIVCR